MAIIAKRNRSFKRQKGLISAVREAVREELQTASLDAPLDSEQACRALNVSRRKLDELVAAGHLRPIRIGTKRLFTREGISALLRAAAAGRVK